MKGRLWRFALLRAGTLVPVGLGLWMIVSRAWVGPGIALVAYGFYQAWSLVMNTPQAGQRLIVREEKQRRGIHRRLHHVEKKALFTLLAYVEELEKLGGDPSLGQDLMSKAWDIISQNAHGKRKEELAQFMASLPPLKSGRTAKQEDVMERLRRECDMLYASQAEIDASTKGFA